LWSKDRGKSQGKRDVQANFSQVKRGLAIVRKLETLWSAEKLGVLCRGGCPGGG